MAREEVLDDAVSKEEKPRRDSSSNTDSNRVLVTKRAIYHALRELMEEVDFSKISVGDIIERSGVSRSTFYRCFSDKYDVVNWSYKRYKNILVKESDQYYSFETGTRVLLRYMRDNQSYYAQALRYTGQNCLRDYMYETTEEYVLQCWHEACGREEVTFAEMCSIRYCAAGMTRIIEVWVRNGCREDVEDVLRALSADTPSYLRNMLY